jgi:mRNA interferase HigB
MRIIARRRLREYWDREPGSKGELSSWFAECKQAQWRTPAEVKSKYRSASILKDGRVVFNICGNRYRLVVWINYDFLTVYIRFIGTHDEYDEIDAQTV